mmetsp:Transcript_113833/g.254084  ORF Transcript_113833/g.254084 Transcript_113833/m.254084 type:complete len:290 (+) Transcript_113833:64-933(+)
MVPTVSSGFVSQEAAGPGGRGSWGKEAAVAAEVRGSSDPSKRGKLPVHGTCTPIFPTLVMEAGGGSIFRGCVFRASWPGSNEICGILGIASFGVLRPSGCARPKVGPSCGGAEWARGDECVLETRDWDLNIGFCTTPTHAAGGVCLTQTPVGEPGEPGGDGVPCPPTQILGGGDGGLGAHGGGWGGPAGGWATQVGEPGEPGGGDGLCGGRVGILCDSIGPVWSTICGCKGPVPKATGYWLGGGCGRHCICGLPGATLMTSPGLSGACWLAFWCKVRSFDQPLPCKPLL